MKFGKPGNTAVSCTLITLFSTVISVMLYNDQEYVETVMNSVIDNNANPNDEYNLRQLQIDFRKEIYYSYTIIPITCTISQIWSIRILISSKMQSPKHGQRVSVACLMSMSGTMCAYVILKYSLSIQNEILGIYILMKFMPPLVALLTTTGHLYVYFYMFQKISTKQIDDTLLAVGVESIKKQKKVNGKSYSSLNSQKYGGVEGPGMFAGNEFITPPPNGIPMAGMPQQLQDPSIFANQKLIQQQMQQMQKQQQQQRAMLDPSKKRNGFQNEDSGWGSVKDQE